MGKIKTFEEKTCQRCGKDFSYKSSQSTHYKNGGSYCSSKCAHSFTYTCKGCGKVRTDGYVAHQGYCDKKCQYAARSLDPIRKKAFTMSSFITFGGQGKLEHFDKWLRDTLDTPCKYCKQILTLENVSIDHIEPFGDSKARKNLLIKRQMDRIENLQIICRACNAMKGELNDKQFSLLVNFMETNPKIGEYLKKKLGQSQIMWTFKRKK